MLLYSWSAQFSQLPRTILIRPGAFLSSLGQARRVSPAHSWGGRNEGFIPVGPDNPLSIRCSGTGAGFGGDAAPSAAGARHSRLRAKVRLALLGLPCRLADAE